MGNRNLALPLGKERLERSRRVLGSQHPDTHKPAGDQGVLAFIICDDAAATPLLREAVLGLTAVYGTGHHHMRHYQQVLDGMTARLRIHQSGWLHAAVLAVVVAFAAVVSAF